MCVVDLVDGAEGKGDEHSAYTQKDIGTGKTVTGFFSTFLALTDSDFIADKKNTKQFVCYLFIFYRCKKIQHIP